MGLTKRVAMALVGLLAVATMSACDDRPCLAGHYVTNLQPMLVGKVTVLMPVQSYVCDRYGS